MRTLIRALRVPLTSEGFDRRYRVFAWQAIDGVLMIFGMFKVSELGLDEPHLFLGYAIVFALTLLCAICSQLQSLADRLGDSPRGRTT